MQSYDNLRAYTKNYVAKSTKNVALQQIYHILQHFYHYILSRNKHLIRFILSHPTPHSSIDLREHPAVEMLVVLAAFGDGGAVVCVLLLPDSRLGDIVLTEFLRMVTHALNIVRHPLRGFDHLPVPRRTF